MKAIGITEIEAGDLILAGSASSPSSGNTTGGWVLRQMTPTEVAGYVGDGSLGVWVLPTSMSGGPQAVIASPNAQVILSVIRSHKAAADDLGPLVGLADGA